MESEQDHFVNMLIESELREWMEIFDYKCVRVTISRDHGISFVIHTRDHQPPHLHAKYQENEAVIGIPDGNLISGTLPAKKLKQACDWVRGHADYLEDRWEWFTAAGGIVAFA